jgi:transposase
LSAFLGYLWSFTRIFIKAPSGRQRFNVLGAINAVSKELVLVTNTSYITSIQVCEMLVKIALRRSAGVSITIVLDNARYQRCKLVMEKATELGIELLFLPPYSPNLNLIERLWKFVKKARFVWQVL